MYHHGAFLGFNLNIMEIGMCDILKIENLKKDISFLCNATIGRGQGGSGGGVGRELGNKAMV